MSLIAHTLSAVEAGYAPDSLIRAGIRKLLRRRLEEMKTLDCDQHMRTVRSFIAAANASRIAESPEKANTQHYEVPSDFFLKVLGPHLKYSCCLWRDDVNTLAEAEEAALVETTARAQLANGMQILELGCGWGSLSLWMAEHYPNSSIVSVSNSNQQREYITTQAGLRGLRNLRVLTADMNDFSIGETFDRVLSVEMFEHMRNHRKLMQRISGWLKPGGKLFVHIFCHRDTPYLYEDRSATDWMTRHFFSGGMMPSDGLLLNYQDQLSLENQWRWDGTHYERTCNAWLRLQDTHRDEIIPLFETVYGSANSTVWWNRWRIFFMACAELFGYHSGNEWWVSHYLFSKPEALNLEG